ncbi:lysosomal acid glucosylceramidase isoform X2 [Alosa sapidissima]|uniref:lysosomal acid glucosylceramidase isoform X2 n=1 Tax=Alosa sapidissima TaxID=34773 RepID=UPI001C0872AF|nr:lysosomal acid glucosylceramidase isoform X2 [Alosa sapidissima]
MRLTILFVLCIGASATSGDQDDCVARNFGHGSVVCECNASHCDSVGSPHLPRVGQFMSFLSSKEGRRLARGQGQVLKNSTGAALRLTIVPYQKYQKIKGFGGAMTDAAAINILSLSGGTQNQLLRQYFAPEGIGYSVVRVPMASCDFSTRLYTYADTPGDYGLNNFTLSAEDINMKEHWKWALMASEQISNLPKIPLIQKAQAMSPKPLSLLASAWSAPAWMKTNGALTGKGTLKGQPGGKEYKTWAQYYVRFLEEYGKFNLSFWAVTTGNEPTAGEMTNYSFQALGFRPETQRDWVAMDLGPALHASLFPETQIIILDDQRLLLPHWAKVVLSDVHAARYIHGIGVHWYMDGLAPAELTLGTTHHLFPEYFLFGTEACAGFSPLDRGVKLGSWERAEEYAHDIIEDLNHYVTGWTDWNLALDLGGGPNWVKNFVDSPVIVDSEKDVFYKQPMFYSMSHFSKFLWEGSQRLGVSYSKPSTLESSVFMRLDGAVVIVVLNRFEEHIPFEIWDPAVGFIPIDAPAHSILTVVWATQ